MFTKPIKAILYLFKKISLYFANYILKQTAQDISLQLQKNALYSTTKYVEQYLISCPEFKSKKQLLTYALSQTSISGIYCEFGVYKGETINFIARHIQPEIIHGFDSFEGLPETWRNGFEKGTFSLQGKLPKVQKNVILHKGWFEESLPNFLQNFSHTITFLHMDADLYSATQTVFNYIKPQIKAGTIIVFDEYFNFPGWQQHEYKAFQEFILENKLKYQYLAYNSLHEQVVIKIL